MGRLAALRVQLRPWVAAARRKRLYEIVNESELRDSRRSDTLFLFGSGASLNDISARDLAHFEEHDTMGFNWFVREEFVRCDYHLVRGIPDTDFDPTVWKSQLLDYFRYVRENPRFHHTLFLVQAGLRATNGNRALGFGYLPEGARIFLWRTNSRRSEPGRSFSAGLTHGHSTLQEAINLAWLVGWRDIVLVGVDLYDRRYFWAPEETRSVDARRGATAADPHTQSSSGLILDLSRWSKIMAETGTRLSVYNERSLLAEVLPLYSAAVGAS